MVLGNKTKKHLSNAKYLGLHAMKKISLFRMLKKAKVQSQSSKSQVEPYMTGPYYYMKTSLTDFTITRHALPLVHV